MRILFFHGAGPGSEREALVAVVREWMRARYWKRTGTGCGSRLWEGTGWDWVLGRPWEGSGLGAGR